jgi:hypothetical protein
MLIAELLIALVFGIILAALLTYPLRREGPGPVGGLVFFFLLLFLAIWAGGRWLRPAGPPVYGVSWLGFLFVGILVALILAAAVPPRRPPVRPAEPAAETPSGEVGPAGAAAVTLGVFFYVALLALLVVLILGYAF